MDRLLPRNDVWEKVMDERLFFDSVLKYIGNERLKRRDENGKALSANNKVMDDCCKVMDDCCKMIDDCCKVKYD
jgi:hypothetical protein